MSSLERPVLRFYGWSQPAASFGYFQRYREIEGLTLLRPLVRRPTGGGLVPHDADWTYSLAFPTNHPWYSFTAVESYRCVHEWLQSAFARLGIVTVLAPVARPSQSGACFAGYEQSDLLWERRKIAGAAQRRRRDGLLIQGSIQPPPLAIGREAWQAMMCKCPPFAQIEWEGFQLTEDLKARATRLALQKYSQANYNQRR